MIALDLITPSSLKTPIILGTRLLFSVCLRGGGGGGGGYQPIYLGSFDFELAVE